MKIFHYTTIDVLALILKNRTLRFNNAGNVNDPDECITEDFGSFQPYCFISCWTQSENELIPFWNIYADNGKGVRLEIDTRFIKFRGEPKTGELEYIVENVCKEHKNSFFINLRHREACSYPYFKTKYSDEKRIFKHDTSTASVKTWRYDIVAAFNTKKTCWAFENEIRFILLGCKCENASNWLHVFNEIRKKKKFSDKYVDLQLEQDFFDNLKIVMGPKTTESSKVIIQALINQFDVNKKIEISESKILMK